MINDELVSYVRDQLSQGIRRETITNNLKGAGWQDADINEAFDIFMPKVVATPVAPIAVPPIGTITSESTNNLPAYNTQIPAHSSVKKPLLIFIILALLIVGGTAAYAYHSGAFVTLPSLINDAVKNSGTVTSSKFDIKIDADMSELNSKSAMPFGVDLSKLSVMMQGRVNSADPKNSKVSMDMSMILGLFVAKAEIITLGKDAYVKVTEIPAMIQAMIPKAPDFINKWYSYTNTAYSPNVELSMTKEQKEHITDLAKNLKILNTSKKLAPETINGELSYHFAFDINAEELSKYLVQVSDYLNSINPDPAKTPLNIETAKKEFEKIKDISGEIWIGRSSKMIGKVNLSFDVVPDLAKAEKAKINLSATFSDWNKPVDIEAPANSIPLTSLIDSSISDARQKSKEAAIKANLSNDRVLAELFYDSHNGYGGLCGSKELNDSKLKMETDGSTNFFCRDRQANYILGVKMPGHTDYMCIDSTGFMGANKNLPTGAACALN
jgi:hypothetical protein